MKEKSIKSICKKNFEWKIEKNEKSNDFIHNNFIHNN